MEIKLLRTDELLPFHGNERVVKRNDIVLLEKVNEIIKEIKKMQEIPPTISQTSVETPEVPY